MTASVEAVAVLVLALALDLALGDPSNRYHPVAWMGAALARGRRFMRSQRPAGLLVGGALVTLVVALAAALGGAGISWLARAAGPAGLLLEALVLKSALSLRGLCEATLAVHRDLEDRGVEAARATVGTHLVSRATGQLDEAHVASAAIESAAENLGDSVVGPLVFFLVLGLPGALVYRVVNTADAMFGYRVGALEYFGKVAARLDDLFNLVPARLSAAAIVAGAALARHDAPRALAVMRRDRGRTASPNAGWPMAAMAGALGVVLEKPGTYRLGAGAMPRRGDIVRSVTVLRVAAAVAIGVLIAARLLVPLLVH